MRTMAFAVAAALRPTHLPPSPRRLSRCRVVCSASPPEPTGDDAGDALSIPADWRTFRASLVRGETGGDAVPQSFWAHSVPQPESGCVLVARPDEDGGFFRRSVVLLISHGDEGTLGLALNKPLGLGLASVSTEEGSAIGDAFAMAKAECFVENELLSGGPVSEGKMLMLHSAKLATASRVMDGVYCGGLLGAIVAVRSGQLSARECRFFSGYSAWDGGQLEGEIDRGYWALAATSKDYILDYRSPKDDGDCMWQSIMKQIGENG